ncbi:hypothetical protein GJAV_G00046640 [Gymnothorax javanicus]|nr:hypothetical protein GJAV_G00046640 [Gymnothorax javanicus]
MSNITAQSEIKIKRVSSRKRSRDSLRNSLTAAMTGGSSKEEQCFAQRPQGGPDDKGKAITLATTGYVFSECHSDNEDLFGDYDSIVGDSSFLARMDDMELNLKGCHSDCKNEKDPTLQEPTGVKQPPEHHALDFTALKTAKDLCYGEQEVVQKAAQGRVCAASTPEAKDRERCATPERKKHRRSMAEQLKRAMAGNAAASSAHLSWTSAQKEAVLTKEITVAAQAMESVSCGTDLGPFFGLPSKVKDLISRLRGIQELYEWQKTCLTLDSVQRRRNLIYSLPTSGGKTLVAEILILKELLCRKKNALLILPYISLVQEKVRGLAAFGLELGFLVEEYAGSKGRFPPVKRRNKQSLYIATIEKGHSLVNSLVETGRLDSIGLLVVDELHMLGEGSRGAVLEMALAKVQYVSKETQIIGMSATLSNVEDLKEFLKADNYTNDFRPVQLKEYVKLKDCIYEIDPKEEHCFRLSRPLNFKYSSSMQKIDPDHIIALVTEVIPAHSCLVFCATKKSCENVALMICKYLKTEFVLQREGEKAALLGELKASGNGSLCPVLGKTVPYGLAYHHSGLTGAERRLVEEAYMAGILCLLTCTSTLAAGINLPARRVILRSPYVAMDFLKRSQYKQMVGRAGRAGIDTAGESILILQERDKLMAQKLVSAPMEKCYSNLMHDSGKGVQSLILSLIGLSITKTVEEVGRFMSTTLLHVQEAHLALEKSLREITQDSLRFLIQKGLVSASSTDPGNGTVLAITKLGRATYKGSIDLTYSDVLHKDLSKGLECLMLNSFLHLVYLVTPYEMVSQCKPDWMIYFRQFSVLSAAEQKMSAAVGVPESFVARKAAGQSVKKAVDTVAVNRLYLALVLFSLLKDTDLWSVAGASSCRARIRSEPAQLRLRVQLMRSALHRRAGGVLGLQGAPDGADTSSHLLRSARAHSSDGGHRVLEGRAKQLYNSGHKTLAHLANADPRMLVQTIQNLSTRQANQIVASAKMLLTEKAEALQEEANDLLTSPLDLPSL